jgi:hypothetical protein
MTTRSHLISLYLVYFGEDADAEFIQAAGKAREAGELHR